MADIYTDITIKDLTATEEHPDFPRNVTIQVSPDGSVYLLGILNHQTKLGIDHINAELLIRALKRVVNPNYNPADETRCGWTSFDIQSLRPDLTIEQCREVMDVLERRLDNNIGYCWDNVEYWANESFPPPEAVEAAHETAPDSV